MSAPPLLEVKNLKKHFPITGGLLGREVAKVHAVDGVSFDIRKGETLSVVGESGCGKSTVGKAILRLYPITDGEVWLDGKRIDNMSGGDLRPIHNKAPKFDELSPSVDLLPTGAFVRRPLLWLDLISRNGGTIAYSPTFGYELCARRAEAASIDHLDLSRWRSAGGVMLPI